MKDRAITTGLMNIKRIIKKYYEQLYVYTSDNLVEKEKFLGR